MNLPEWLRCTWSDENYRTIKTVNFHRSELDQVINLPMPAGAVVREQVVAITEFSKPLSWFKKRWVGLRVGEHFQEFINQGWRHATVLAIDDIGNLLYEYEMPAGKVFMRIDEGGYHRPISPKQLDKNKKWQLLINGE